MHCIVCGYTAWTYVFAAQDRMFGLPGQFREYRCTHCGLMRLYPKPSKEQLKKYYPSASYYSYRKTRNYNFFRSLRSYLISHLYRPSVWSVIIEIFVTVPAMPRIRRGRILDVGCGSGETMSLLQSVGWDVYGLDIDKNAIGVARTQGLQHASVGSHEDIGKYPDHFFDVIRMYHVIEHLSDPLLCLRLARRKLKSGGEIIVGTPNEASFVARVARQYWYNLDCPRHLYLFTPQTLGLLLKKAKFTSLQMNFCSAGGVVGSMQYVCNEIFSKDINLINRLWVVLLVYPFEWFLDRLELGDVFVTYAK